MTTGTETPAPSAPASTPCASERLANRLRPFLFPAIDANAITLAHAAAAQPLLLVHLHTPTGNAAADKNNANLAASLQLIPMLLSAVPLVAITTGSTIEGVWQMPVGDGLSACARALSGISGPQIDPIAKQLAAGAQAAAQVLRG